MASDYRRGFKKEAEELALGVRREMCLGSTDPLDPRELARFVEVPVFELQELGRFGFRPESLRHLLGAGKREFSAALFERDGVRLIVANSAHSSARQASNIVHECAHLLLEHKPPAGILVVGCRRWDAGMEREADWLAGEMLVPREAALDVARQDMDVRVAAQRFGVSVAMMEWRLNHSGARKQAQREHAARRGRRWDRWTSR